MTVEKSIEYCQGCNTELAGNYCTNCGRPNQLTRIKGRYILSEISLVLNFNKGIFYTIKELILRPGKNIQEFIMNDRKRLVKPIVFIIICSLIYTLVQQLLNFEDGYVNYDGNENSATTKIFAWVANNYGYANILMAIFIAIWIKILFRKYDYNFFEILILLCFVMGVGMLIYTCFGIIESFAPINGLKIGGVIGFLYAAWGIGQFFDKKKVFNYFKGFISYVLGMLMFSFAALGLGVLIDFLLK